MSVNILTPGGYSVMLDYGDAGGHAPADSTRYYFGRLAFVSDPTTVDNDTAFPGVIPIDGTIKAAAVFVRVAGTLGSSESHTMELEINNGTPFTAVTGITYTAATQSFSAEGLSQAVSRGDRIKGTYQTPAWATNPTAVYVLMNVYVEIA